jgi:hypothetical protein
VGHLVVGDVYRPDFMIAGGRSDVCLQLLVERARELGYSTEALLHDADSEPRVTLDHADGGLFVDGRVIRPRACFIRMHVGASEPERMDVLPRAPGWFAFAVGVVLADPEIAFFNRRLSSFAGVKMADLRLAQQLGLAVPATIVSNDAAAIGTFAQRHADCVAKPVNGGGYCSAVASIDVENLQRDGALPLPAFVQERLDYPEYRVYRIGKGVMVFRVDSQQIDYRIDPASAMVPVALEATPVARQWPLLLRMSDILGLDFCAFDLKMRRASGELCFMEVNSGPMFAAHDYASGGALGRMLLGELLRLNTA